MLDNMKMLGALAGLMKNKDKLREAGERIRAKMEATRVTGEAGGGAARATVSGTMKVIDVTLTPALVRGMAGDTQTHELASGLIAEAVNNGLREAQVRLKAAIDEESKALGLEGVIPDLAKMLGAS